LGIWRRKMELLLVLTQREVLGRYRGSMFGVLWSFFNPLLMLVVYTVAFRDFLHMQWPGLESRSEFTLMVFSGMIVHGLFAEVLARAPTVILGNANFVKKLVFPLEVLPGVSVLSSVFHAVLSILVLIGFVAVAHGALPLGTLWLPLIIGPFVLFLLGVGWALAALGVYVRDISQLASVLTSVFLFLSPVVYPASQLSEPYRQWIAWNPLTLIIEQTRAVMIFDATPDFAALGIYTLFALTTMLLGFAMFQKTRGGFADVL